MLRIFAIAFITVPFLLCARDISQTDINSTVLEEISTMPKGGGYSTRPAAMSALASSIQPSSTDGLSINASVAKPSFCSGATYIVFLKTLVKLQKKAAIHLSSSTWEALLVHMQPDGVGIWGRWNANGPGTGCLFHELNLGRNFTDFQQARPGDFMKIFWSNEVGKLERGHSVIYLGTERRDGTEMVRFWSSNIPGGYGEKSVPRTKIKLAIFSRLTNPKNIANPLCPKNNYLASLLTKRSSFQEALQQCGAIER